MKRRSRQEKDLLLTEGTVLPAVPGAKAAAMPERIEPMLATLAEKPFSDPEWLFEYKWDGVRAISYLSDGRVRILSRNQTEIGHRYPELMTLADWLDAEQAVVDGEIVALGENGLPSFQALQSRIGMNDEAEIARITLRHPVLYLVFDLIHYNGFDLTPAGLIHRKALLKSILETNDVVRFSEHVIGKGEDLYRKAKREKMEGIVAKHAASPYVKKRSKLWLKVKVVQTLEVVIGGYTEPRGSRKYFGALMVGLYQRGALYCVGHVGGGFSRESLASLYAIMQPLRTDRCPFANPFRTDDRVQWIRPLLVCEIKFAEWTDEERLRQPIFLRLRDDKTPDACSFETASRVRNARAGS
jgi:bifunctional non-homologous end joining protein LigD